jgi:HEAT repeat protein
VGFASTTEQVTDLGAVSSADAVDFLLDLAPRIPGSRGDDALIGVTLAAGVDPAPRLLQLAGNAQAPVGLREKAVFWAAESGATAAQLSALYARENGTKVREQILFAYSRIQDPSGARELLRVARGDDEVELRKKAIFWLGQRAGEEITRDLGELVGNESEDEEVREQAIFAISQRHDDGVPALLQIARTNRDPRLRKRAIFWLSQSGDPRAVELFESILTKE